MAAFKRDPLLIMGLIAVVAFVVAETVFQPDALSGIMDRFDVLGILLVSVVAQWRGTRAAVVSAIIGFIVIGAVQPRASFLSFGASQEVFVDLLIFLAVALVQGVQTGHLRRREEVAEQNERRMSLLSRLVSRLVPSGSRPTLTDLLDELAALVGARHALLLAPDAGGRLLQSQVGLPEWFRSEQDAFEVAERAFETGAIAGDGTHDEGTLPRSEARGIALPVATSEGPLGAIYVSGRADGHPFPSPDIEFLSLVSREFASFLERERLQGEMAETAAEVAGDRLKASLLSSVSHEIRTPLAAATAIISGLVEEAPSVLGPGVQEELRSAQESLELLNRQFADILDISRIETSSWEPSLDWNDLRDVCAPLVAYVSQRERHRVECQIPGDLPLMRFDPVQLTRALGHILENALAYSGVDSPVTIGGAADDGHARVWIEDAGPGLSEAEKRVIFQKFQRGSASSVAPHGSGLGLAIARELVAYNGGVIRVEDVVPHGARFVVELPINPED